MARAADRESPKRVPCGSTASRMPQASRPVRRPAPSSVLHLVDLAASLEKSRTLCRASSIRTTLADVGAPPGGFDPDVVIQSDAWAAHRWRRRVLTEYRTQVPISRRSAGHRVVDHSAE